MPSRVSLIVSHAGPYLSLLFFAGWRICRPGGSEITLGRTQRSSILYRPVRYSYGSTALISFRPIIVPIGLPFGLIHSGCPTHLAALLKAPFHVSHALSEPYTRVILSRNSQGLLAT